MVALAFDSGGVTTEKEIILILVNEDIVENILSSLYDKA